MKLSCFIALLFAFSALSAQAQFSFKPDSDFKYYSDSVNLAAKIPPPDFSKADFEMRFYVISYANFPNGIYIFTHTLAVGWVLTRYRFCSRDMVKLVNLTKDSLPVSDLWKGRWDTLLTDHILTLPTESKVKKRWKSSSNTIVIVGDGVYYRIELFTANSKRRYRYSNPEEMIKTLDIDDQELVDINKIIRILANETKYTEVQSVRCP